MIYECDDSVKSKLVARGYTVTKSTEDIYMLSSSCPVSTTSNPTISEKHRLSKQLRDIGVWSYCDGDVYILYISPVAGDLSTAAVIYHIMFFFASITRYHPDLFDEIISAKEYWL